MTPQLRLAVGLIALLLSIVFVADFAGLLPRPEEQLRESRKLLGEALAVQLSSAAANGGDRLMEATVEEIVRRNKSISYAGLIRENGNAVASFGERDGGSIADFGRSSLDNLIVPIYSGDQKWGEARLQFAPTTDWGLRYFGMPLSTLRFVLFLGATCLLAFYVLLCKALAELNPTRAVPERVNAAFNVLAEGVLILDEKERIVLANQSIARLIGEESERLVGKNPASYAWDLRGDDLEELPWQKSLKRGEHVMGMPLKLDVDGEEMMFTVNSAPIVDGEGGKKGVLITFDDVTPLEAKNKELAKMLAELSVTQRVIEDKNRQLEVLAMSDPLTGCLNRRAFLDGYARQHEQAGTAGSTLSVLMIDVDHFKLVNDRYGHLVGDQVIRLIAQILQNSFGDRDLVGRYGGEEFIVAASGCDLGKSIEVAEQLRQAIKGTTRSDEVPVKELTVSIGVASLTDGQSDAMVLVDQADRALYQAKETGRDRVCVFDPSYQRKRVRDTEPEPAGGTGKTAVLHTLQSQLQDMEQVVRRQASEITHKAMHDEFTGLPNRFLLQDRLAQAMKLSDRNDSVTAVVSISLSAYRRIYDLLGYDAADEMIREAARRVEGVVRSVDTIGIGFDKEALTFSRISDNELAMLVVDIDSVGTVTKVIERVTRALERTFTVRANEVANDVFCGIALYPHDGKEPDLLIRNASLARNYAERRSPRSGSAYFSRDIDSLAAKNAGIAAELRHAIREGGLEVMYQPKVDATTHQVTGVEALARWRHPEFGHVSPAEFIGIAENIGVIDQLTDSILSRVCDDISNGALPGLRVSINISALELHDSKTAERILRIIDEKRVSPYQLEIEITESSILNNFELARSILAQLQNRGFLVVLDDFGTAYSSLNLLLEIPVDIIKVDRSFVTNLQNARDNRAVVRAIIQMAHAMGKRVVAEGVETPDERDCLIRLGCREMQGFYYSKPMAFADLQTYIREFGMLEASDLATTMALEQSA